MSPSPCQSRENTTATITTTTNIINNNIANISVGGGGPKISKDSHSIKKTPSSSFPSSSSSSLTPQQQQRQPVIIYTQSPKVIMTNPRDFKALVQKLTGMPPLPPPPQSDDADPNIIGHGDIDQDQERIANHNSTTNNIVINSDNDSLSSALTTDHENCCGSCDVSTGNSAVNSFSSNSLVDLDHYNGDLHRPYSLADLDHGSRRSTTSSLLLDQYGSSSCIPTMPFLGSNIPTTNGFILNPSDHYKYNEELADFVGYEQRRFDYNNEKQIRLHQKNPDPDFFYNSSTLLDS